MFDMTTDYDAALSDQARAYLELARQGTNRKYPRQLKGHLDRIKAEFLERFDLESGSAEAELIEKLGKIRPPSLAEEIELAAVWITQRDENARRALVMAHFPRMLRVVLRSRSGGEDWLDFLHDAMVDALAAVDRLETYDYEAFSSQASLQALHRRTRHMLRMQRPIAGPGTFEARRAASRILFHDIRKVRSGDISLAEIDRSCRHSPAPAAEISEMQEFLFAEDTDALPDQMVDGGIGGVEDRIDASRIAEIVDAVLDPRAAEIIRRRWLTADPEDAEDVGEDFGITAERVRQIERQSLQDIRAHFEGRKTSKQIAEERDALKRQRKLHQMLTRRSPRTRVVKGVDLFEARPQMKKLLSAQELEVLSRRFFSDAAKTPYAKVAIEMGLEATDVRAVEMEALSRLRRSYPST